MTYQDKNTFWHDKPCNAGKPSSNNRNIYTASAKYLAPNTVNMNKVFMQSTLCIRSYTPLLVDRLPDKLYPPMSKDEAIAMVSLGLLTNEALSNNYYNFCNIGLYDTEKRKLTFSSTYKAAKELIQIRGEHRNYFWGKDRSSTYPLAFKLAPWDIYYVKKFSGVLPSILETIFFYLNIYFVIKSGNKSTRMMLYLQLRDLNHSLLGLLDVEDYVLDYFGEDHPFYKNNFE